MEVKQLPAIISATKLTFRFPHNPPSGTVYTLLIPKKRINFSFLTPTPPHTHSRTYVNKWGLFSKLRFASVAEKGIMRVPVRLLN